MKHTKRTDCEEINSILGKVKANARAQEMKQFMQHGSVSTFEHCESVAALSYTLNKKLRLHANVSTLLMGAMLHDFFLYDWHKDEKNEHRLHGFRHAETACRNAEKYFGVGSDVQHVIWCHMWPLNPLRLPRSREAWIVCFADKCVSLYETLFRR